MAVRRRCTPRRGWPVTRERSALASAVLVGDLALAWADDMFARRGAARRRARERRAPVSAAMRTEVLAGQYLDVLTQATGDASVEAALKIDRLKTAALHRGAAAAPGRRAGRRAADG